MTKQRLAAADGYTLVELLIVMAILGVILGGIGGALVSGQRAQNDTNARVAAQGAARTALDRFEFVARRSS